MGKEYQILRVVDGDRYEVNKKNGIWKPGDEKRSGPLPYVRLKTMGWDWGPGYRQLLEVAGKKHAAIAFAFFIKCLEVGARQPPKGRWLIQGIPGPARNSGNSGKIAEQLGWLPSQVEKSIEVLTDSRVRWLEWVTVDDPLPGIPGKPGNPPTGQDNTGQDKQEEENTTCPEPSQATHSGPASEFVFPTTGKGPKEWALPQAKFDEYVKVYPHLGVLKELRKARQWCRDNPTKRKTARGMLAFLTGWLNRAQDEKGKYDGKSKQGAVGRPGLIH